MNRPIDWKKISELKRQAPPPENPFGDMLSELLESDLALPEWDEPAPAAAPESVLAEPVIAESAVMAPEAVEPALLEPALLEQAMVEPALQALANTQHAVAEVAPLALPAAEVQHESAPPEAESVLEAASTETPASRQFDESEPVYLVTPNLEIHAKVELALSELSDSSVRYSEEEHQPEAHYIPGPVQAGIPEPAFAEFIEPDKPAAAEPLRQKAPALEEPQASILPQLALPRPLSIRAAALPTPQPINAIPAQPPQVEDLLESLLIEEQPLQRSQPEMVAVSPVPVEIMVPASQPLPPAAEATLIDSKLDLDDLIQAMDREVERSPFVEKIGASTQSIPEPVISRESCLVFSLGGTKFGIPIHQVVELDKLPRVTPVPNVPYWVRGVTNLRGEILTVLDLRLLLGMERRDQLERGRILVVRLGEDATTALVVDEVSGIANYAQERLTPPGAEIGEKIIQLLDGIYSTEELALKVLNVDKLRATPELRQLEAA